MYIVHVGSVQICIKVIISSVGAGGMAMKGSELFYQLAVGKRVIELNQLKKACYAKNRLYQGNHDKLKNQFKF